MEELSKLPIYPFIIIAALLGGLFTFTNSRKNSYREASLSFRKNIDPTITELKNCTGSTVNILKSAFNEHEEAVREFSKHLLWSRKSFQNHWINYTFQNVQQSNILYIYRLRANIPTILKDQM